MKRTIITAIIILSLIIFGDYMLTTSHEAVHKAIFRSYGIESEIHMEEYYTIEKFGQAYTKAETGCPTEECTLAHNINEAIGYTIITLFWIIGLLFLADRTIIKRLGEKE